MVLVIYPKGRGRRACERMASLSPWLAAREGEVWVRVRVRVRMRVGCILTFNLPLTASTPTSLGQVHLKEKQGEMLGSDIKWNFVRRA